MFLCFETLRTETATEKINKLHIDHSLQSVILVSWMDRLTGILYSQSDNLFKIKPGESLIQQANTGAPVLPEIQLSRSYHLQSLLQESLQEVWEELPGFN